MSYEEREHEPDFEVITRRAMERAYEAHETLGISGEEEVQKNQFGETALRADLECEEAVIRSLREAGVPMQIIAEEHGTVDLAEHPRYLGILDGLDGSNRYKAGRGSLRYGTMLGEFSNIDPRFREYDTSAIMEHTTKTLFIAKKGAGCWQEKDGVREELHVAPYQPLGPKTRIYVDEHWEANRKAFMERLENIPYNAGGDLRSFAAYFADLVSGDVDAVLHCTRKGNLEPAIGFGMIREAGGVIVTLDGEPIDEKKYAEFGHDTQIPLIAASSEQLARELIAHLGKSN